MPVKNNSDRKIVIENESVQNQGLLYQAEAFPSPKIIKPGSTGHAKAQQLVDTAQATDLNGAVTTSPFSHISLVASTAFSPSL